MGENTTEAKSAKEPNEANRNRLLSAALNPVYCVSAYLVYLLLRQIAIVADYLGPLQYPLLAWAYLIIGYSLLRKREFFSAPWQKVLVLLLPAAAITLAVNFAVNPVTQVKSAILLAVSLLLVYPTGAHVARSANPHRELAKVLLPAQIVTGLQAFTSVVMIGVGYTFLDKFLGVTRHLGVQSLTYGGNRVFIVFGMNVDSNHAALFGIVSIFVTTWAYVYREKIFTSVRGKKVFKLLYWINLALLVLAIPAANSRGAKVALFTALAIVAIWLFVFYYRRSEYLQKQAKVVLFVWVLLFGGVGYLAVNSAIEAIVEGEIGYYSAIFKITHNIDSDDNADWKMLDDINMLSIEKGDAAHSARVYIWAETLQLWQDHAIVGIGPYNTDEYAKTEHLPTEQHRLERGYHVHNSYLDVLISYGVLGFGIYVVFFIGCLVSYVKVSKARHADWADFLLGAAWLTIMAGVMLLTDSFLGFEYMFGVLLVIMSFLIARPASSPMRLPVIKLREVKLVKGATATPEIEH